MRKTLPRRIGEKLILSVLCLISFLFFSNDFSLVDIQKTAIVLAAGIDRSDDGKYEVTAVIAKQQSPESGSPAKAETAFGSVGETVADAVRQINAQTGQIAKFPFCDLVLLGESATKEDVFSVLGYFFRNEYASDNCLLATCEGKAADMLAAKIPSEDMTTEGLKKILSSEAKKAGNVSAVNLKDFAADYFAEGRSGHMPYLRAEEKEGKTTINPSRTALFSAGKIVAVLSEEESFALNLLDGNLRTATLNVAVEENKFSLGLKSIRGDIRTEIKDGLPVATISFSARAQINDDSSPQDVRSLTDSLRVPPEALQAARSALRDRFAALTKRAKETNCDFLHFVDRLKKKSPRLYRVYKNDFLARIEPKIEVKIEDRA